MNAIVPFAFEGHDVRVVERDGEPWFVAKDVAGVLGYSDTDDAIRRHCKSPEILKPGETPGLELPPRGVTVIPERDIYRLIMRSKLPSAERFEEWVVGEVLPSIRKTGQYGGLDLEDPAQLRSVLLDYSERVIELQAELEDMRPKADSYEYLTRSDGTLCVTDAAKTLGMRPKDLFNWLKSNRWLYRRAGNGHWVGYQDKIQTGYLDHRVEEVTRSDGTSKITEQVRVTAKGMARLGEVLQRPKSGLTV